MVEKTEVENGEKGPEDLSGQERAELLRLRKLKERVDNVEAQAQVRLRELKAKATSNLRDYLVSQMKGNMAELEHQLLNAAVVNDMVSIQAIQEVLEDWQACILVMQLGHKNVKATKEKLQALVKELDSKGQG